MRNNIKEWKLIEVEGDLIAVPFDSLTDALSYVSNNPVIHVVDADQLTSAIAAIQHLRQALKNLVDALPPSRVREEGEHALSCTSGYREES